eukprot:gene8280-17036_t
MDEQSTSSDKQTIPVLYKCEPVYWMWLPKSARIVLGWTTVTLFSLSFLVVPLSTILLYPPLWKRFPILASSAVGLMAISLILPPRESRTARKIGQLWYDLFDVSCNLSDEKRKQYLTGIGNSVSRSILAMHPHGIIPIQAIIWSSYCDQYMAYNDSEMYGFGAAADAVFYIPFLRNFMYALTAGSASYSTVIKGLNEGISIPANATGRHPTRVFLLPGGVAEVFLSTIGKHAIVAKRRKGLARLALEAGADIVPCYVFGATDFFSNLATGDNFLSQLSRKLRLGITLFWGRFFLPIPYSPKVTLCIGDPISVKKWEGDRASIPNELVEELLNKYIDELKTLFDTYKAAAGYPDAVLEIGPAKETMFSGYLDTYYTVVSYAVDLYGASIFATPASACRHSFLLLMPSRKEDFVNTFRSRFLLIALSCRLHSDCLFGESILSNPKCSAILILFDGTFRSVNTQSAPVGGRDWDLNLYLYSGWVLRCMVCREGSDIVEKMCWAFIVEMIVAATASFKATSMILRPK